MLMALQKRAIMNPGHWVSCSTTKIMPPNNVLRTQPTLLPRLLPAYSSARAAGCKPPMARKMVAAA
jgi:hypothetical protein